MHWLMAARQPRLSETEPKWFVLETSYYALGGRIRRQEVSTERCLHKLS